MVRCAAKLCLQLVLNSISHALEVYLDDVSFVWIGIPNMRVVSSVEVLAAAAVDVVVAVAASPSKKS